MDDLGVKHNLVDVRKFKLLGKLMLTRGLISGRLEFDHPSSTRFEMRPWLESRRKPVVRGPVLHVTHRQKKGTWFSGPSRCVA
jgi:hypothetical protein